MAEEDKYLIRADRATVTFEHADGRKIIANAAVNQDGTLDIQFDFGDQPQHQVSGVHHFLCGVFMGALGQKGGEFEHKPKEE